MLRFWRLFLLAVVFSAPVSAELTVNVDVTGLDSVLESNVRLYLSIEQQKHHPLLNEGRLQRLHQKAIQEISSALQPFGYYRPLIDPLLEKNEDGSWRASYAVAPGPALEIGEFRFTISEAAAADPEFQQLIEKQALQPGQVFSHLEYEGFKANLARLAEERGYFMAQFVEHRVEIDLNEYVARVYLSFDAGPRYRFGALSIQQEVLEAEFLARYLPFASGDYYSLDGLIELQQALNDTNYFQIVEVSPGQAPTGSTEVPIEVVLTPRKNNRYSLGVGYGTDTGARTKFGWERPRVNKKGHRFDSEIGISEIGHNLVANYRVPILNPRTDQLVYSISEVREELDDVDSERRTVGISLNRRRGAWRETLALNYEQEDFELGNDKGDTTLLIPGVSWSRNWGNNFIFAIDGLRFDFGFRAADTGFGSDVDFTQVYSSLKFISSLNRDNRIIARGSIGSTATDDFAELPPSIRFFTGGSQTVRGYKYQSLGPEDDSGDVIGARRLLTGSLEFDHALSDTWGVAVFYDVGNAIEEFDEDLEHGAGFGIRWKSPIGPVRFDLASALSEDGEPWRLHINIGPDL
jgi:translocation and assembly module TamA